MDWLIRNNQGTLLEAGMGKFEGRSTVIESELSVLIWSMQACSSLGYRKVIFEGDNLSTLKYIKEEAYSFHCQLGHCMEVSISLNIICAYSSSK